MVFIRLPTPFIYHNEFYIENKKTKEDERCGRDEDMKVKAKLV